MICQQTHEERDGEGEVFYLATLSITATISVACKKVKVKALPITGHEGSESE